MCFPVRKALCCCPHNNGLRHFVGFQVGLVRCPALGDIAVPRHGWGRYVCNPANRPNAFRNIGAESHKASIKYDRPCQLCTSYRPIAEAKWDSNVQTADALEGEINLRWAPQADRQKRMIEDLRAREIFLRNPQDDEDWEEYEQTCRDLAEVEAAYVRTQNERQETQVQSSMIRGVLDRRSKGTFVIDELAPFEAQLYSDAIEAAERDRIQDNLPLLDKTGSRIVRHLDSR